MKVLMTGGHHSSALPLIDLIQRVRSDIEIIWVGHKTSLKGDKNETLEYKEITSLGIPFYDLKAGKVYRNLNVVHMLRLPLGFIQAFFILLKIKPDVILSFGGYLAVPVVICAWIMGIPSITHEQTVVVGYANKIISLFVKKILVSWHASEKYFSPDKVVYSGLPLRENIFKVTSNVFESDNNLPYIFVFGGKTGSHVINTFILNNLEDILSFSNLIHQTGDHSELLDYDKLTEKYSLLKDKVPGVYFPKKFILGNEIGEVYSRADVVISRSGAHTIYELYMLRKKCILIPIPWVSHNEQYENAKLLKDQGLATVIDESVLNDPKSMSIIRQVLSDEDVTSENENTKNYSTQPQEIILDEIIKLVTHKEKIS